MYQKNVEEQGGWVSLLEDYSTEYPAVPELQFVFLLD